MRPICDHEGCDKPASHCVDGHTRSFNLCDEHYYSYNDKYVPVTLKVVK